MLWLATALFGCNAPESDLDPGFTYFQASISGDDFETSYAGWGIRSFEGERRLVLVARDFQDNEILLAVRDTVPGIYLINDTTDLVVAYYKSVEGVELLSEAREYPATQGLLELDQLRGNWASGEFFFNCRTAPGEEEVTVLGGRFGVFLIE